MKRYIILFAIFITAVFFYPVFAYADLVGEFFVKNPMPVSAVFFVLGTGLLITAGITRKLVNEAK